MGDLAAQSNVLSSDEAHFGAPVKAQIAQAQTDLHVLPCNWLAAQAITSAGTQWQYDNHGIEIALDYQRADIAWGYSNINLTPKDFDKLQLLERSILAMIRRPDEQQPEPGVTLTIRR
ncbi:hypothetical protein [Pseudoalteromonas denitrificans]|uniref:Uncharacterized protein n=1 Tax=Pseudoalteromonas denitrificans DSM 6059 TaxID=1123010 RepID=A0A1I1T9C4_9GAMM|nr:hypothetical protein [Pseudoalteromonas denitrificans]SFD55237.1 hypothetical protein SAMN02745724_04830 [Pseudoalteromonas denitrificans DSM 6059]